MIQSILLTFLSGVVGTALGGLLPLIFKFKSKQSLLVLFSFSAGMMISMVCFDLLPEAVENSSITLAMVGCAAGVLILLVLDSRFHHHDHVESDNLHHHHQNVDTDHKMMTLGFLMIVSVALHNFPEGMAIGSSATHELNTGILMAILLTLHNIPEGMGMIAPLISGGMRPAKALFLVALSGLPTLFGGILGYFLGTISFNVIGFTLALAAGCMLYVTYYEILPQVQLMGSLKKQLLFQLCGFLFGFWLIYLMR